MWKQGGVHLINKRHFLMFIFLGVVTLPAHLLSHTLQPITCDQKHLHRRQVLGAGRGLASDQT